MHLGVSPPDRSRALCASARAARVAARLWMLVPATVFLAASMTSNLNIGVRHILPIYPFLTVLAAVGAWIMAKTHRAWGLVMGGLVLFHAASSLRAFPNYLSYSNELWGGPSKTYRVLTDSNVDWGQGLPAAKHYLETHPATPCWLAYFGSVDPAYYHLSCTAPHRFLGRNLGTAARRNPAGHQGNGAGECVGDVRPTLGTR